METAENELQSTFKSRTLRLKILIDKVKKRGTMPELDLLKFGMKRWMMSRLIVQRYIDDLVSQGELKRTPNPHPERDYLEDQWCIEITPKEGA